MDSIFNDSLTVMGSTELSIHQDSFNKLSLLAEKSLDEFSRKLERLGSRSGGQLREKVEVARTSIGFRSQIFENIIRSFETINSELQQLKRQISLIRREREAHKDQLRSNRILESRQEVALDRLQKLLEIEKRIGDSEWDPSGPVPGHASGHPWGGGAGEESEPSGSGDGGAAALPRPDSGKTPLAESGRLRYLIEPRKWYDAWWQGVSLGYDPTGVQPPFIGIHFKSEILGKEIFARLRGLVGDWDEHNAISVSIAESGEGESFEYTLRIGNDATGIAKLFEFQPQPFQSGVCASLRVKPQRGSDLLDKFKRAYEACGEYLLFPCFGDTSQPIPEYDIFIRKREIEFRKTTGIPSGEKSTED